MTEQPALESIDAATFADLLTQYHTFIPAKLADLEKQRMETIPQALKQREMIHITRDELIALMDWKLAHGKFRAALPKLIAKNDTMSVKSTTIECFRLYTPDSSKFPTEAQVKQMIDIMARLSGVGPATASLLLSVYDLDNIPFFSDELYRWAMWSEPAPVHASGWSREIKYTAKDYLQLYPKVQELRTRLNSESSESVTAVDVEKVAYVLGKRAAAGDAKSKKRKVPSDDGAAAPAKRKKATPKKLAAEAGGTEYPAPTEAGEHVLTASTDATAAPATADEPTAASSLSAGPKPKKASTKKLAPDASVNAKGSADISATPVKATAPPKPKKGKAKQNSANAGDDAHPALIETAAPPKPKKSRAKKVPTAGATDESPPGSSVTTPAVPKSSLAKKPPTGVSDDALAATAGDAIPLKLKKARPKEDDDVDERPASPVNTGTDDVKVED